MTAIILEHLLSRIHEDESEMEKKYNPASEPEDSHACERDRDGRSHCNETDFALGTVPKSTFKSRSTYKRGKEQDENKKCFFPRAEKQDKNCYVYSIVNCHLRNER